MGKKSRFKQGYFDVTKSLKYQNPTEPCIYRSSYEFKFMHWCEVSDIVARWSSEPFSIKYLCLNTGKQRNYYIDFTVTTTKPEVWLIEVKPVHEVTEAERFGNKWQRLQNLKEKRRFADANKRAAKNWSKWQHAQKVCNDRGWRFIIVTEKFLNKPK